MFTNAQKFSAAVNQSISYRSLFVWCRIIFLRPSLGLSAPSMRNVVRCSRIRHYFTSGVQVVVVQESAAHCNAVFFPPIVTALCYFWVCKLHLVVGKGKEWKKNCIIVSGRVLNYYNLYA
jgi:hypothetical protein